MMSSSSSYHQLSHCTQGFPPNAQPFCPVLQTLSVHQTGIPTLQHSAVVRRLHLHTPEYVYCAVRAGSNVWCSISWSVSDSGRVIVGLSPLGTGFYPRSVHVAFVVNRGPVGQVFFRYSLFPPSAPFCRLHIHLRLHAALTRGTKGCRLGTFHKAMFFRNAGGGHYVERGFRSLVQTVSQCDDTNGSPRQQ